MKEERTFFPLFTDDVTELLQSKIVVLLVQKLKRDIFVTNLSGNKTIIFKPFRMSDMNIYFVAKVSTLHVIILI
jgi:hypothetical protein